MIEEIKNFKEILILATKIIRTETRKTTIDLKGLKDRLDLGSRCQILTASLIETEIRSIGMLKFSTTKEMVPAQKWVEVLMGIGFLESQTTPQIRTSMEIGVVFNDQKPPRKTTKSRFVRISTR